MEKNNPPEWAMDRAFEVLGRDYATKDTFSSGAYVLAKTEAIKSVARYIAEHEEEPVDPLLLEAREMTVRHLKTWAGFHVTTNTGKRVMGPAAYEAIREGRCDECVAVVSRLEALKRGIELGKEQSA